MDLQKTQNPFVVKISSVFSSKGGQTTVSSGFLGISSIDYAIDYARYPVGFFEEQFLHLGTSCLDRSRKGKYFRYVIEQTLFKPSTYETLRKFLPVRLGSGTCQLWTSPPVVNHLGDQRKCRRARISSENSQQHIQNRRGCG